MTATIEKPLPAENKKKKKSNAVSIIALILGALLLLYPVVSTLANHNKLMRQTEAYSGKVEDLSQEEKTANLPALANTMSGCWQKAHTLVHRWTVTQAWKTICPN